MSSTSAEGTVEKASMTHSSVEDLDSPRTYASVAQRRFPGLVLDFVCVGAEGYLTTEKLTEFLRDDLKLSRNEILKIRKMGGTKTSCTIKIQTIQDIVVSERFGTNREYKRDYPGISWTCTIRGGRNKAKLRFLNVPEEVESQQLVESISSFAKPLSDLSEEVFGNGQDAWLSGIPNGNMQILVEAIEPVPDFVCVGRRKIRIIHKDQIKRCFLCGSDSHLRDDCVSTNVEKWRPTRPDVEPSQPVELENAHGQKKNHKDIRQ